MCGKCLVKPLNLLHYTCVSIPFWSAKVNMTKSWLIGYRGGVFIGKKADYRQTVCKHPRREHSMGRAAFREKERDFCRIDGSDAAGHGV